MSKRRRYHRQSATAPRQIKAEGREPKVSVTLVGDDGRREVIQLTESQFMQLMDNRAKSEAINATSESGKEVTLTVGSEEGE